ncbi:MAG TPA: hypothetical protein VEW28_00235 [Candidatus Kapabacteria bacterium]|nr:hypothetical protein [Candidatus Kapabacteria bacterium]
MRNVIFIALLCASLASCDLFTTRNPESPDLGTTFIWTPAATPNTLLDNFTGALSAVDPTNYARCFLSSQDTVAGTATVTYTFTPRAGLDPASKSLFDSWTMQSEQNFLTKLHASLVANPQIAITISNLTIDQSNASNAAISADYLALLPLPTNSTLPDSIKGTLKFQMMLVTTPEGTKEWRVVNWTDLASASAGVKTFTDLKVQLSS